AHRLLIMPMRLLGQATAQVYLGEAPVLAREDPTRLRRLFSSLTMRLFWLGLGPAALIVLAGPWLAVVAFGPPWADARRAMHGRVLIAFALSVVSPISQILSVFGRPYIPTAYIWTR